MDSDGSNLYSLLAALFLLALKALCSLCEFALTEVDDSKVRDLASTNPAYSKLFNLISRPRRLLVTFSALRIILTSAIAVLASAGTQFSNRKHVRVVPALFKSPFREQEP